MTALGARPASSVAAPKAAGKAHRAWLVWTTIVVASVVALVMILTLWVDRQMLDNHAWKNASTDVVRDENVQNALAAYLVNQLYDNANVAQSLQRQLPPNLKGLADPLAGALRQPATNAAAAFFGRPKVQELWINATTIAHQKLLNVLENKTGYGISTGNGVVTLNLHDLVVQLAQSLGLSGQRVQARIPPGAGVITIMRSDQLDAAQRGVRGVKILSVWLLLVVLGLYALAVYLARGARRAALRNVGWALTIVGVVVLLLRRLIGNYAVDALASPSCRGTIHDVWLTGTAILGQIGDATVMYGLILVGAAALAGPTKAATWVRARVAATLNAKPAAAGVLLAGALLILFLWGPTHALRTWWGMLLFAALVAAGAVVLRRQTLAEFAPGAPAPGTSTVPSMADELARLATLRSEGAISNDEYVRAKEHALS